MGGGGAQPPTAPPLPPHMLSETPLIVKKKKEKGKKTSVPLVGLFLPVAPRAVRFEAVEINVFLSISSSSSTVHRFFVVFPHLLWLSRYSFFDDKLGFTNTGKFFLGVVTWFLWISFSNKFFYLVVLCLCSFPTETLIFIFGLEHKRTTNKKIQFRRLSRKISGVDKSRTGSWDHAKKKKKHKEKKS